MVMKKISKSLNQLKMIVAQTFAADNSTDDTSKDTKIERSLKLYIFFEFESLA